MIPLKYSIYDNNGTFLVTVLLVVFSIILCNDHYLLHMCSGMLYRFMYCIQNKWGFYDLFL